MHKNLCGTGLDLLHQHGPSADQLSVSIGSHCGETDRVWGRPDLLRLSHRLQLTAHQS